MNTRITKRVIMTARIKIAKIDNIMIARVTNAMEMTNIIMIAKTKIVTTKTITTARYFFYL